MLKVENLVTYHGRIKVLHGLSFHVDAGEIVAIVGPNGAGKSTLLGTLAGLYKPAQGKISLDGAALEGLPAYKMVRKGIHLVPEGRQIFMPLTVKENLLLGMYPHYFTQRNKTAERLERVLTIFPNLKKHLHQPAGGLSGGEQQMLAIGRAIMSEPKIMMLDEPSMGLAPRIVSEILKVMKRIRDDLKTRIILVEQNVHAALKIADRAYVLERGNFVLADSAQRLLNHPHIRAAYLGYREGDPSAGTEG